MAKKRKTRQEKIILQLKRKLAENQPETASISSLPRSRQEAISAEPKTKAPRLTKEKRSNVSIFSYNPSLVRKDLLKTLILALVALSLEFMLYLKLR